jgi:hypothetical protein
MTFENKLGPIDNSDSVETQSCFWCSSNTDTNYLDQTIVSYVSVLISLLLTIYTSLKTSAESKSLGITIKKPEVIAQLHIYVLL